ncbi:hypothetical protein ACQR1I_35445 [Bradyrhizobium sp. HKCCYLS2038]|uniref:hypothetical protein n=1 Tax=unclassified Bradyrhizobium TaxID=2631580 RepID=UPI003EBC2AEF
MKAIQLKATAAEIARVTTGTAANHFREMQAGKLVEKGLPGRHGGVVISNSGRVNTLLGFIFDPPFGESRVALVKRLRRLAVSHAVFNPLGKKAPPEDSKAAAHQFVEGIGVNFSADLGTALDGIVGAFRTGAFGSWEAGSHVDITVEFNGERSAAIYIDRPAVNLAATFLYYPSDARPPGPMERITRLSRKAFEMLATDNETAPDQD